MSALGVPADLVEAPSFAIRSYQHYKNPDPPEPLLLNSFFLGDLAAAGDLFLRGAATPNLQRYLGASRPATRRDLLHDTRRWPRRSGRPRSRPRAGPAAAATRSSCSSRRP